MRRSLVWIVSLGLVATIGGGISIAMASDEDPPVDVNSTTEEQIDFLFSEAAEVRAELTAAVEGAESTAEVNGLTSLYSGIADRLEKRALELCDSLPADTEVQGCPGSSVTG